MALLGLLRRVWITQRQGYHWINRSGRSLPNHTPDMFSTTCRHLQWREFPPSCYYFITCREGFMDFYISLFPEQKNHRVGTYWNNPAGCDRGWRGNLKKCTATYFQGRLTYSTHNSCPLWNTPQGRSSQPASWANINSQPRLLQHSNYLTDSVRKSCNSGCYNHC